METMTTAAIVLVGVGFCLLPFVSRLAERNSSVEEKNRKVTGKEMLCKNG